MRIYIAGIIQETNTFSPVFTDISLFERGYLLEGEELKQKLLDTNTEIGGFYHYFKDNNNVELVPGVAAWAVSSGKIRDETLHTLTEKLFIHLKDQFPVDGVLLALHGALVSENDDDCEGYILKKVRELVGPDIPVVSTLDYHASISESMVENADLLVGYRTYPHVDFQDTGEKAAQGMEQIIEKKLRPRKIFKRIPLILPVENTETESGPMSHVIAGLQQLDKDPLVMSTSVFCPQPWLDVPETGVGIITYTLTQEKEPYFTNSIQKILNYIWRNKDQFFMKYPDVSLFIDQLDQYQRPMILIDSGDITSAGGMGDSTEIFRELLKRKIRRKSVITIIDRHTVNKAFKTGEGNTDWFEVGGETNYGYNQRIRFWGEVIRITDEPVTVTGSSFSGITLNMGRRVLLKVNDYIYLIVSEFTTLIHDQAFLRSIGLDPLNLDIIVQKSHKLFRDSYKEIAKSIVVLDTPGFTDQNLTRLPFSKVNRPIYPLDNDINPENILNMK